MCLGFWLHYLGTRLRLGTRLNRLGPWLSLLSGLRNLWLWPYDLRSRLSLRWQSGPRLGLSLRRPASLSLRRASFYSLRRRRDDSWLRRGHVSNCALCLLPLNADLLLRRAPLLL